MLPFWFSSEPHKLPLQCIVPTCQIFGRYSITSSPSSHVFRHVRLQVCQYTWYSDKCLPNVEIWEMYKIESVLMTVANDPGQLFKAVGDITNVTKHGAISRILKMNCSKSFKQKTQFSWFHNVCCQHYYKCFINFKMIYWKKNFLWELLCWRVMLEFYPVVFCKISLDLGESLGFPWIQYGSVFCNF